VKVALKCAHQGELWTISVTDLEEPTKFRTRSFVAVNSGKVCEAEFRGSLVTHVHFASPSREESELRTIVAEVRALCPEASEHSHCRTVTTHRM
jgi:hypothetical protein